MKINSREELNSYLENLDISSKVETPMSCVYFLVTYDNETIPVYFEQQKSVENPGHTVYFESSCDLKAINLPPEELEDYVRYMYREDAFEESLEYEKKMQRGNTHYEIENYQMDKFLPDQLDDIQMISETECLDWLLSH